MDFLILIITIVILAEATILLMAHNKDGKIFGGGNKKRKVYIDTSALIDGRILSVAQTGFMNDDLIIPRSVIRELQLLADGKDMEKRQRARFGLDTANELERVVHCNVSILADPLDHTPVDERLIHLAKTHNGLICTTDFNLGKVAATEGIEVLNVNDLAKVLRTEFLPGERVKVKITGTGNNAGQGIGHLADGTLVVVDNAANNVGTEITAEVIRFIQTSAGRMLFARSTKRKKKQQ